NIKRLDLELFFSLRSPAAQRMYRFLDKRFYNTPRLSLDLVEFACGHVGLTESHNVAVLKRRLAPAIAELEEIGFLRRADAAERGGAPPEGEGGRGARSLPEGGSGGGRWAVDGGR